MTSKAKGNHPKSKEVSNAKLNIEITGDINVVQLQTKQDIRASFSGDHLG